MVLPAAMRQGLFGWTPAVAVGGQTAVWISRVTAFHESAFTITLLRFDQALVTLALHAGSSQPGGLGWRYGDVIGSREGRIVVAAFNSAFQESYGAGGFEEGGRVGWPLRRGAASVVIYRDGVADIGRWHGTVPAAGRPVQAVRQNLGLLIDGGRIPPNVDTCIKVCWGDPLHEQPVVARSALGITSNGDLVWAGGHDLSVRALAQALAGKGVVRAMELDINPRWVAGYVYEHPSARARRWRFRSCPDRPGSPASSSLPTFATSSPSSPVQTDGRAGRHPGAGRHVVSGDDGDARGRGAALDHQGLWWPTAARASRTVRTIGPCCARCPI